MMKFFRIKYLQTHGLIKKIEFNDINIDKLFDIQHNQLSPRVDRWTHEGSGRSINLILQHQLIISKLYLVREVLIFHYIKS